MLGMDVLTCNVCIVPDINARSNFQIKNYVNFYLLQEHIHENFPSSHPSSPALPLHRCIYQKSVYGVPTQHHSHIKTHIFRSNFLSQLQLVDFLQNFGNV